jgi:hypothetical protein
LVLCHEVEHLGQLVSEIREIDVAVRIDIHSV